MADLYTELLTDIAKSLRELAMSLASIENGLALVRMRDATRNHAVRSIQYFSGRWPVRDGNSYGIVAAQPPIQQPSPDPAVHGDRTTRHL